MELLGPVTEEFGRLEASPILFSYSRDLVRKKDYSLTKL